MDSFSCVVLVFCSLFAVGSSAGRRRDGYRCPDNVSDEECQNYQCPPNSELVECVNFCNTCEDGKVCIDYCLPGCNCKAGYFRNLNGACVRKAQCPRKSGGEGGRVNAGDLERCNQECDFTCRREGSKGGKCRGGRICSCTG